MVNKHIEFTDSWGDTVEIDLEGSYLPGDESIEIPLLMRDASIALDLATIKDFRKALDIAEDYINRQLKERNSND